MGKKTERMKELTDHVVRLQDCIADLTNTIHGQEIEIDKLGRTVNHFKQWGDDLGKENSELKNKAQELEGDLSVRSVIFNVSKRLVDVEHELNETRLQVACNKGCDEDIQKELEVIAQWISVQGKRIDKAVYEIGRFNSIECRLLDYERFIEKAVAMFPVLGEIQGLGK